jgi:hypothetical protein
VRAEAAAAALHFFLLGISHSESASWIFAVSGEAIILGFQHYILALGTAVMIPAVLVPMMGGSDVSAAAAALLLISPNPFATTHGLRTHFSAFCCRRGTG